VRPQSILALALLLTPVAPASPATSPSESPKIPSLLYTVAKTYEPLAWLKGADRFSADAAIYIRDENGSWPLIRDFTSSADPAVSFDGKTVLSRARFTLRTIGRSGSLISRKGSRAV